MIKKSFCLVALFFLALNVRAIEAGVIAGSMSQPDNFIYGLSAGVGAIVPMVKFEFEGYRIKEDGLNSLSAAIKVRPKFGGFAPYVLLGAGGEFETLSFRFSEYRFYTMVGGGLHVFISSLFSLRFDLRFLHSSDADRTRISGGAFFHL